MTLSGCAHTPAPPPTPPSISAKTSAALHEAIAHFTYDGQPIHPQLVMQFEGWLSDGGPIVVTVDVAAAQGSNQYSAPIRILDSDLGPWVHVDLPGPPDVMSKPFFQYVRLGTLADGTQVLETASSGGGSGVFEDILFLRFSAAQGYAIDPHPHDRLLMTVVGSYPLGDRDDGKVQVLPDRVIVGVSKTRDKPMVLRLR